MQSFKFLHTNTRKENLVNVIFKDYLDDLNDIVHEMIYYDGRIITTKNGRYYITNITYDTNNIYSRAICYPNEFPNLLIRMSTYPNEVNITIGQIN